MLGFRFLAEREGFEPPDLLQSTVFKTAAFDRSAISPNEGANITIKKFTSKKYHQKFVKI